MLHIEHLQELHVYLNLHLVIKELPGSSEGRKAMDIENKQKNIVLYMEKGQILLCTVWCIQHENNRYLIVPSRDSPYILKFEPNSRKKTYQTTKEIDKAAGENGFQLNN